MQSDSRRDDIDIAWSAGRSRRSVTIRWVYGVVAVAVGLWSILSRVYPTVGTLVLLMSVAVVATIHHRALSSLVSEGISDSVTLIVDEHLIRIRASIAGFMVIQLTCWIFAGIGAYFFSAGIQGEPLLIGTRQLPPAAAITLGAVCGGYVAAYAIYEILLVAASPDHRTWSMHLDVDGIEIIRGWHILYIPWTDLIAADPVPEPKTSLLPRYSATLHYRTDTMGLATKTYKIWGHWIPTNPKHFLQALRDYHQHPDLRAELGHPASVNRITRHT